jgi:hypothetical protein
MYVIRLVAIAGLALSLGVSQASATAIDLTTSGSFAVLSADLGGTFGVIQITPQSTGSGVIDSFLRINSNRSEERAGGSGSGTGQPASAGQWSWADRPLGPPQEGLVSRRPSSCSGSAKGGGTFRFRRLCRL